MTVRKPKTTEQINSILAEIAENWTPEIDKQILHKTRGHLSGLTKKGTKLSEEHRKKLAEAHAGRRDSEETRRKKSNSRQGIKFSEEHKRNIAIARKTQVVSEENIKKMIESNRGIKHSVERKGKVSASLRQHFSSEENREKRTEMNRRLRAKPVSVDGNVFACLSDAAKFLGVSNTTVTNRIRSIRPEWKGYHFVIQE